MDIKENSFHKKISKRVPKQDSKKYDVYDMRLINKRNSQMTSRITLNKENKKKHSHSLVDKPLDSGIDHLEYLKEKNLLARKRLLDLQKRLVELNSKGKSIYRTDDLKMPHVLDLMKDIETSSVMQKYSVVSLAAGNKNCL